MDKKFLGQKTNNVYHIISHHFEYMHVFLKGKELFVIHGTMEEAVDRLSLLEPLIEVTNKKAKVSIMMGDIFDYAGKVEAIIDPTNTKLKSSSGLGYMIQQKAGAQLRKELDDIGPQSLGTAFITDAYDLECKYIIHTVAPMYIDGFHNEEDALRDCYENCLQSALDEGIQSIAFPSISTGGKGFPSETAAEIAIDVIYHFWKTHTGDIGSILFVLNNKESLYTYKSLFKMKQELEP